MKTEPEKRTAKAVFICDNCRREVLLDSDRLHWCICDNFPMYPKGIKPRQVPMYAKW